MKIFQIFALITALTQGVNAQVVTNQYIVSKNTTNIVTRTLPFDEELNYNGKWRVDYFYSSSSVNGSDSVYVRSYAYHDLDLDGKWDFYMYHEHREICLKTRYLSGLPYRWYFSSNSFIPNLDGKSVAVIQNGVEYPTWPIKWFYLTNWTYYDTYHKTGAWAGFPVESGTFDVKLYGPAVNNVKPELGRYRIEWLLSNPLDKNSEVLLFTDRLLKLNKSPVIDFNTLNYTF